jgi:hypothetical protein
LRILVAKAFAERNGIVPGLLGRMQQRRLDVVFFNWTQRVAMHTHHVEHRIAIAQVAAKGAHALGNPRRLRIGFARHQCGNCTAEIAAAV